jgi:hypothetical protein
MRAISPAENRLRLIPLFLYSIAMGYAEAAVVVYLRTIYYPQGFELALSPIETNILRTEIGREIATLVMILGIALVSYRTRRMRAGAFLLIFGTWDIFYYVFLKALLDWPSSIMTLDVLFLIPAPWISPVVLPISISVVMIGVGLWLILKDKIGG